MTEATQVVERLERMAKTYAGQSLTAQLHSEMHAYSSRSQLMTQAATLIRTLMERNERLEGALKPIAEAMAWEESEGNFGAQFMPDAPAERFRDEVELRFVAWWGKDWELESADTFCTLGDLRRARKALERP